MDYQFLVDTFMTERLKVLSVWSMFRDDDMPFRPHSQDQRGRSVREHMVHQCVSENLWFCNMLGIDVGAPPLPGDETRLEFIHRYSTDSGRRVEAILKVDTDWWEEMVSFFEVPRSRAWIMVRRIAHTAHHRGQQAAMLRMLNRDLHSTYGPSADTGGLMADKAPTLYAYPDEQSLLDGEQQGGRKSRLPNPPDRPVTERPD